MAAARGRQTLPSAARPDAFGRGVRPKSTYADSWNAIAHAPEHRIQLDFSELLAELRRLPDEHVALTDDEYPFVLSAGERRSSTANTIFRDPTWRKKDVHGALRVSPADADRLGLVDGADASVTTKRGSVVATVEISDTMQPGMV